MYGTVPPLPIDTKFVESKDKSAINSDGSKTTIVSVKNNYLNQLMKIYTCLKEY